MSSREGRRLRRRRKPPIGVWKRQVLCEGHRHTIEMQANGRLRFHGHPALPNLSEGAAVMSQLGMRCGCYKFLSAWRKRFRNGSNWEWHKDWMPGWAWRECDPLRWRNEYDDPRSRARDSGPNDLVPLIRLREAHRLHIEERVRQWVGARAGYRLQRVGISVAFCRTGQEAVAFADNPGQYAGSGCALRVCLPISWWWNVLKKGGGLIHTKKYGRLFVLHVDGTRRNGTLTTLDVTSKSKKDENGYETLVFSFHIRTIKTVKGQVISSTAKKRVLDVVAHDRSVGYRPMPSWVRLGIFRRHPQAMADYQEILKKGLTEEKEEAA